MTYTDQEWEYIVGDTWYHDAYFDLMCDILQNDKGDWIEKFTLTDTDLREIFNMIESYWKHKVEMLLHEKWEEGE